MNTNEELKNMHRALVREATVKCVLEGSKRTAVAIGNEIVAYGKKWADAFADDGKVDLNEMETICAEFDRIVDTRIPARSFSAVNPVTWGYNFLKGKLEKLMGITWCLAVALSLTLAGCIEAKASHQNGVVAYVSTSGQVGFGYGECEDVAAGCKYERDVESTTVTAGNLLFGPSTNHTHTVTRWDTMGMKKVERVEKVEKVEVEAEAEKDGE